MRPRVLESQRHPGPQMDSGIRLDLESVPVQVHGSGSLDHVENLVAVRIAEPRGEAGRDLENPEGQSAGTRCPAEPGPDSQGAVDAGLAQAQVGDTAPRAQRHVQRSFSLRGGLSYR